MQFEGATAITNETILRSLKNYKAKKCEWKEIEDQLLADLSKTFKPSFYFRWFRGIRTLEEYLDDVKYWNSRFLEAYERDMVELTEEQLELYVLLHGYLGVLKWEDEYYQLRNLAYSKAEVYASPIQCKFIRLFK